MVHTLQKSKCSIFHNILKYMIFQMCQKVLLRTIGLNESHWNMANCQIRAAAHRSFENYLAFCDIASKSPLFIMSYRVIARQKSEKTYNKLRGSWKCRIINGLLPDACHLAGPTVAPFVAFSLVVVAPFLYWFDWFDSFCPIKNLSVKQGRVFELQVHHAAVDVDGLISLLMFNVF